MENPFTFAQQGFITSNPPYGERLESEPALIALYSLLGRVLKNQFPGWRLSLFSGSPELLACLGLRAEREFKAKNGPLNCIQKNYLLSAKTVGSHSMVGEDFANRLKKMRKNLINGPNNRGLIVIAFMMLTYLNIMLQLIVMVNILLFKSMHRPRV